MILDRILRKDSENIIVSITSIGIAILSVYQSRKVNFYDFQECDSEKQFQALTDLVNRYDLAGKHCRLILTPGQYQLLMTDALNVPDEEMKAALKWKIKDLLDYPVDNMVLDIFPVPVYGANQQNKKVYAIAADKNWLLSKVTLFQDAYLPLAKIDVADLALRNILAYYPNTQYPALLLHISGQNSKIMIFWQGDIYLIRQLYFKEDILQNEQEFLNTVLLELQRSLNYCNFELKLGLPICIQLIGKDHNNKLTEFLAQNLKVVVELIDLNKLISMPSNMSVEMQQRYLYCMGEAMEGWYSSLKKQEGANAATN